MMMTCFIGVVFSEWLVASIEGDCECVEVGGKCETSGNAGKDAIVEFVCC